jgi:protein gp37
VLNLARRKFDLTPRPERLNQPLTWRRPRMIFVNSMSDLFHKEVRSEFIDRVFDTMETADWHIFQVLTKRNSLMRDYLRNRYANCTPPERVWLGVSVEDAKAGARVGHLREVPARVRFLSIERLIGRLGCLNLDGIHWVIAGGESGPKARPMQIDWVREIRDQCRRFLLQAVGWPSFKVRRTFPRRPRMERIAKRSPAQTQVGLNGR